MSSTMLLRPPLPAADVLDALYVSDWQLDIASSSDLAPGASKTIGDHPVSAEPRH